MDNNTNNSTQKSSLKNLYINDNPTQAEILLAKEGYFLIESKTTQINENLSYPYLRYIRTQSYQVNIAKNQIVAKRISQDTMPDLSLAILVFDGVQSSISHTSIDEWIMANEIEAIYKRLQELKCCVSG